MKALSTIISILSEEEQQEFLRFLQKKNRRGDTKNSALFKLIVNGKTENLDVILYGKAARNAYHALCKRLQDNLIDFIASKSFAIESNEEMEILKLLLAARIFFEHKHYKTAFKTLEKAERNAQQLDVYSILTEIYHTKIQYAHLHPKLALSEIIEEAQLNLKYFQQEQHLNMAYATIKAKLKTTPKQSINDIISEAFSAFNIEINKALTYKSLFQLMSTITTAARLQSNFYEIENFMSQTYAVISEKQKDITTDKHLYYHIEILHAMAVTLFRNKNFTASKAFSEKMELEMEKKNGVYKQRFQEKLILNKALVQIYTGECLAATELLPKYAKDSLDIQLTLAMGLFQQNRWKEAYQIFKDLHHSDVWYEKKSGWLWVLKKSILEILVLIELDRLELVLSRLQSFTSKFSKRLKEGDELRVLNFIKLVGLYYENPNAVQSEAFKNKVEASFNWIGKEREDIFVMSFYAWLKAKMEQKDVYEVTLELVH